MRTPSVAALLALLPACGHDHKDSGHDHDHDHDHGDDGTDGADGGGDGGGAPGDATLHLRALAGGADFACGASYPLGGDTLTPTDLRFFLSEVVVWGADGVEVPATFAAEAPFQTADVALVDFEDGTGPCASGTPETWTALALEGAGAGPWEGVGFTVGVPFALNHADAAAAAAPLNTSAMFWSWASGYKFVKIDGVSEGLPTGLSLHLGSTACAADDSGAVTGCDNPNRVAVRLSGGFDPATQAVVLDLDALFAGADLSANTPDTAPVCMSAPNDPDCAPFFANLGLPFGGAPAGEQAVFSVGAQ
jgi:uncharacterized repeat protein (TIGR04052 family)